MDVHSDEKHIEIEAHDASIHFCNKNLMNTYYESYSLLKFKKL